MIADAQQTVPVTRIPLSSGDAGIAQTISVMQLLIDRGSVDPRVREQALAILRHAGVSARDAMSEISAIFWWVKTHMRFQKDVSGGEYICSAPYLLRTMAGDCDDYVVLIGALLKSLGIAQRIVTIAADREEPQRLSHVYVEALAQGEWIPLDATQEQSVPGWEPPRYFRKKIWDRPGLNTRALAGLGQDLATDLEALTPLIGTTEQGVAQIVSAQNQPQVEVVEPTSGLDSAFDIGGSASPIIIIGIGLLAVVMLRGRK